MWNPLCAALRAAFLLLLNKSPFALFVGPCGRRKFTKKHVFLYSWVPCRWQNNLICLDLNLKSMPERLVLKNVIQRISQRVKRPSRTCPCPRAHFEHSSNRQHVRWSGVQISSLEVVFVRGRIYMIGQCFLGVRVCNCSFGRHLFEGSNFDLFANKQGLQCL